jgi:hypothetical protein
MPRLALILAVVAVTADPARAELVVDAGVPFTPAELAYALRLRGAAASDLVVRRVSPSVVELQTSIGRQRVALGAARGPDAARLVALQLARFGVESAPVTGAPPPGVDAVSGPSWTLGMSGGGGHGVAAIDFALTELRADATDRSGLWRWGLSAAWLHGIGKAPDQRNPASADLGPIRMFGGLGAAGIEVIAGPEFVAYRVTAADPGLMVGAGGGVRVRVAGGEQWHAIASADIDGFLHRVIVERGGVQVAATPRVALTAALGVAWGSP